MDDFLMWVGIHQGLLLITLLYIIMQDALSRENKTECPEDLS